MRKRKKGRGERGGEREKKRSGREGRPEQPGLTHKIDFFIMLNFWLCSLSANWEFFVKIIMNGLLVLRTYVIEICIPCVHIRMYTCVVMYTRPHTHIHTHTHTHTPKTLTTHTDRLRWVVPFVWIHSVRRVSSSLF